jgi:hypothetical protein
MYRVHARDKWAILTTNHLVGFLARLRLKLSRAHNHEWSGMWPKVADR